MGIRDAGYKHKVFVVGAVVLLSLALVIMVQHIRSGENQSAVPRSEGKAWFTIDDGRTWFADDANKLPPFDKDGKIAYGCVVWAADNGKTQWVSHVFRYSDAAKRSLTEAQQRLSKLGGPLPAQSELMEVKKPGAGNTGWVPALGQRGIDIQTPKCPTGDREAQPLLP